MHEPPSVLIADDHLMLADLLGQYLRPQYRVVPPIQSLDRVRVAVVEQDPDALVLDLMFGAESALGVIADLLAIAPSMAIVVLSGVATASAVGAVLAQGARGFVLKTASPAEVVTALEMTLAGRRYVTQSVYSSSEISRVAVGRPMTEPEQRTLQLLQQGLRQSEIAKALGWTLRITRDRIKGVRSALGLPQVGKVSWRSQATRVVE